MKCAILDLYDLDDVPLSEEVSAGIGHILQAVDGLDAAARLLTEKKQRHAATILGYQAEEEAAKVLVLLDAVRCPPRPSLDRREHLKCFYNHLAKGIYAEVCSWRPADFAEVARGVEMEREPFHLDGPNDVDWIFPNDIVWGRDGNLYVDYVRGDAGDGDAYWVRPRDDAMPFIGYWTREVIKIGRALHQVGLTSPGGLRVVAEVWGPVKVVPEMQFSDLYRLNRRTLELLEARGLLADTSPELHAFVCDHWPFPLHTLGLSKRGDQDWKEAKKKLRERQAQWVSPDAY